MFEMVVCIFPVLSYRFPIVIGMLPTDWFRSRYPVIPISFSRPIFPFPFPTKKYSCGNGWGIFPTVPDRFHPYLSLSPSCWSSTWGNGTLPPPPHFIFFLFLFIPPPFSLSSPLCPSSPFRFVCVRLFWLVGIGNRAGLRNRKGRNRPPASSPESWGGFSLYSLLPRSRSAACLLYCTRDGVSLSRILFHPMLIGSSTTCFCFFFSSRHSRAFLYQLY